MVNRNDIFISYARADDEIPQGAEKGWVTTLADELRKMLRRKMGGDGASIWMDHHLAGNIEVTRELLDRVENSRILLIVLSPGFLQSRWCRFELGAFVQTTTAENRIFIVETEPSDRQTWHPVLQELTPLRFWEQGFEEIAPRLLGYPSPKPDQDSPYWRNLNELAHLISDRLKQRSFRQADLPAVLLGTVTADLLDQRDAIAGFLRQQGLDLIISAEPLNSAEAEYRSVFRRQLAGVAAFVQLLGAGSGPRPRGWQASLSQIQAEEATRIQPEHRLSLLQWRPRDLAPGQIQDAAHLALLQGRHVQAVGIEEFKQAILGTLMMGHAPTSLSQASPRLPESPQSDLLIYISADNIDRDMALQISDSLSHHGVSTLLTPEPTESQSPAEIRQAQTENLENCDGLVLVYGRAPSTWLQSQFAFTRRVLAVKAPRTLWGALLDAPPPEKPPAPLRSPHLMMLDCRDGLNCDQLARFVETLRCANHV